MTTHTAPILVIGATGRQGTATATALLERGWPVRAFVRDPQAAKAVALHEAGAELAVGDLDDEDSLRKAMDGVHGVFLMMTMMEGVNISLAAVAAEEKRGRRVAEIVGELGISHLVYSSLSGVGEDSGIEYYDSKEHIEDGIRELGLPATILRPVLFMDNFATYNKPSRDGDSLVLALAVAPEVPMPVIAIEDIGRFAALAFDRPDEFLGRTLTIAGDILTPPQIAEILGAAAGLTPRTVQIPLEQLRAFDEQVAKMFAHFNTHPHAPIDLAALRAAHPELHDLRSWLRATDWKL
ncbi:NmrA/HSCARG family protein [Nocardia sp. 2]|uniref:NmrA/HSCARG family protein n=1 Tax=Nocardia acididurans TaxID=2802282 RepID=A0ABS1MFN8_9NOCA|nr:NmrA/HSCARG family protein [Nocardia acididurans]MBL1079069.1 NmrA/HSCARG family protein [Nocardia acididurans]